MTSTLLTPPISERAARSLRQRTAWFVALLSVIVSSLAIGAFAPSAAAGAALHVSPDGNDVAAGTSDAPVATVTRAVQLAEDGDTVVIHPGRYHESVQVYSKRVALVAAPGAAVGDVVFDGASPVTGFTSEGDRWSAPWATTFERAGAPFTTAERPEAGWPEQFFFNGQALTEVATIDELVAGSFFHDTSAGQVWLADDPTDALIEGSDLAWGVYLNLADGSSLVGVTVQRYATQTRNMAAIRAYADNLLISGVTVRDNARIGLSLIGDDIVVEDTSALANGHLGIHAHHSSELTIENSTVIGNNRAGFDAFHSAGGMKITASTGVTVHESTVTGNAGPGIWTDLDVVGAVISSNTVERNTRSGIEIELSSQVVVVDNAVERNGEAGIWVLESSQVQVWHNQSFDNVRDIWIEEGPRADVTDVTIANNLLGGTDRPGAATAILNVDDWTETRAADDMAIIAGSNRYWLVPGATTTAVSRWANWPAPLAISNTIEDHRDATGQGAASDLTVSATNPFLSAEPVAGWVMPADVAAAARWDGDEAPAGPLPASSTPDVVVEPGNETTPETPPTSGGDDGTETDTTPDTDATTGGGIDAGVVTTPDAPPTDDGTATRGGLAAVDATDRADRVDSPGGTTGGLDPSGQKSTPTPSTGTAVATNLSASVAPADGHGWSSFRASIERQLDTAR